MANLQCVGPAGHSGGISWDHRGGSEVVQILISYDVGGGKNEPSGVKALQFYYDGRLEENSEILGGHLNGRMLRRIILDHPLEYITGVEGFLSPCVDGIGALTFKTNKRTYGPFGDTTGRPFSFEFGPQNVFGGFHGRHVYLRITAIGVYLKPLRCALVKHEGN